MVHFFLYGAKLGYWDLHHPAGKESQITFALEPQPEPWRLRQVFTGTAVTRFTFTKRGTVSSQASAQPYRGTTKGWLSLGMVDVPWHITYRFEVPADQVAVMCGVKDVLFLTDDRERARAFSCRSCPYELTCQLDPEIQHPFGPIDLRAESPLDN